MPGTHDGFLKGYVDQAKQWNDKNGSTPHLPPCHGPDGLFAKYGCNVKVRADENVTINVLQEFATEMGVGQSCTDGRLPSSNLVFSTVAHSSLNDVFDRVYELAPETWMCTISQGTGTSSNVYELTWDQV
jgi:hypothetical protein